MREATTWVGITGSRKYPHPEVVRNFVDRCLTTTGIVSGACENAPDRWAVDTAKEGGKPYKELPANWYPNGKLDRSAGFKRNIEIVAAATYMVGFWDGTSRGTRHTIALALAAGRLFRVYDAAGTPLTPSQVRAQIPAKVLRDAEVEWSARANQR